MKKILAMLLALVMMALPVLGLAASPAELLEGALAAGQPLQGKVTLDFGTIAGIDEEALKVINDLVDAVGFTYAQQENQYDFAMTMDGEPVLTFAGATQGEDTYILSNLLGAKPVAFNAGEGEIVIGYLMNMAVESGSMTAEDAAELKNTIIEAMTSTATAGTEVEELDMTGILTVATELAEKVTTAEVTQQPKNCDPAVTVMSMKLTGEDVTKLYKAIFEAMKDMPDFISTLESMNLTLNGQPATAEEVIAKLPEIAEQIGGMIVGEIPVEIYMDANDQPVHITGSMTMKGQNDEGTEETITMDLDYGRLTVNENVCHTASIFAKDAEGEGVSISLSGVMNDNQDAVVVGVDSLTPDAAQNVMTMSIVVMKDYGETEASEDISVDVTITDTDDQDEVSFRLEIENEAEKINDVDVETDTEIDLYIMDQEEKLFTIDIEQKTGEAAASIITEGVVRPGQMTEDEFMSFLQEDVLGACQTALIGLIQNLPASVLSLMISQ